MGGQSSAFIYDLAQQVRVIDNQAGTKVIGGVRTTLPDGLKKFGAENLDQGFIFFPDIESALKAKRST